MLIPESRNYAACHVTSILTQIWPHRETSISAMLLYSTIFAAVLLGSASAYSAAPHALQHDDPTVKKNGKKNAGPKCCAEFNNGARAGQCSYCLKQTTGVCIPSGTSNPYAVQGGCPSDYIFITNTCACERQLVQQSYTCDPPCSNDEVTCTSQTGSATKLGGCAVNIGSGDPPPHCAIMDPTAKVTTTCKNGAPYTETATTDAPFKALAVDSSDNSVGATKVTYNYTDNDYKVYMKCDGIDTQARYKQANGDICSKDCDGNFINLNGNSPCTDITSIIG